MPNWIEGTMKLRGKRENIKRFLENELEPCSKYSPYYDINNLISDESNDESLIYIFKDLLYVKDTKRFFIKPQDFYFDDDEGIACLEVQQAWSFNPSGQGLDVWKKKAIKYDLDIRLYGIESTGEFSQEIIIFSDERETVDTVTSYDDFEWECPFPYMGG